MCSRCRILGRFGEGMSRREGWIVGYVEGGLCMRKCRKKQMQPIRKLCERNQDA
jgi:hypothetical protein